MVSILCDEKLRELFEQFYILTGIRIVLFDESCNEITAYPNGTDTTFCSYMRKRDSFDALCRESDMTALKKCRKTQDAIMHRCHAGLVEIAAPIIDGGVIMGYIMLGQVTDNKDKQEFARALLDYCSAYVGKDEIAERIKKIIYRSNRQIYAAEKILDACVSHILNEKMVKPSSVKFFAKIEGYIDSHMSDPISVGSLCEEFGISRTHLYEMMNKHVSGGIAAFIRQRKMNCAKKLLETTEMPIADIAYATGYKDYNYFLKVFKRMYGVSPRGLRAEKKNLKYR